MSKTRVVLGISLALNLMLLALFAMPSDALRAISDAAPSPQERAAITRVTREGRQAPPAAAGTAIGSPDVDVQPGTARGEWTEQVRHHVAELRGRSVDENTVRLLGVAVAERLYRLRARELLKPPPGEEYWQARAMMFSSPGPDPMKLKEFQRMRRDRLALIEELFGEVGAISTEFNTPNHFAWPHYGQSEFAYVPGDQRLALIEYLERVSTGAEESRASRLARRLWTSPEAEVGQDEAIKGILGPEIFEEYERRSSSTSGMLKYELSAFQPSRAEFDALLRIERDFSARIAEAGIQTGKGTESMFLAVQDQKREAIKSLLGEVRYADYERMTDQAFRHLDSLAREMGLGAPVVRAGYAHIEQARTKVETLTAGKEMSDPKVQAAIQAIQRDLQSKLVDEFGMRGMSEREAQALLGPATSVYPQRLAARFFRWGP